LVDPGFAQAAGQVDHLIAQRAIGDDTIILLQGWMIGPTVGVGEDGVDQVHG
jgi:hypothetical protein